MAQGAGLENRCGESPNDNPPRDLGCDTQGTLADCLALLERARPDLAPLLRALLATPPAAV